MHLYHPLRIPYTEVMDVWWELLWTFLAAWGFLSALWVIFGWLLSGSKPVTVVLLSPKVYRESTLLRLRWLNHLGLLRCRIILPEDEDIPPLRQANDTEYCTLAELSARIEAERERFD